MTDQEHLLRIFGKSVREQLAVIETSPCKTSEEYLEVLSLIQILSEYLNPSEIFIIQVELSLRHFKLNADTPYLR